MNSVKVESRKYQEVRYVIYNNFRSLKFKERFRECDLKFDGKKLMILPTEEAELTILSNIKKIRKVLREELEIRTVVIGGSSYGS